FNVGSFGICKACVGGANRVLAGRQATNYVIAGVVRDHRLLDALAIDHRHTRANDRAAQLIQHLSPQRTGTLLLRKHQPGDARAKGDNQHNSLHSEDSFDLLKPTGVATEGHPYNADSVLLEFWTSL